MDLKTSSAFWYPNNLEFLPHFPSLKVEMAVVTTP
jgi:hypothetical protein